MAELPPGLTAIDETESNYVGENLTDKLQREYEHGTFTPAISDEQIETIKDEGPAAAGGLIGGIVGTMVSPGLGTTTAGALGAFTGGVIGETAKDIYNFFYEPEKAPKTFEDRLISQLSAGGEELVYDLGGRAIQIVGGKAYRVIQPKLKGGVKGLQEVFKQYGGNLTMFQQTDSKLVNQLDSLTRGSMSGKPIMEAADEVNDVALNRWRKDLSRQIASNAREQMSASDFGELIFNTLQDGKAAFQEYTSRVYSSFDDLVKTEIKKGFLVKETPSSIVDLRGKAILNKTIDEVTEQIRPVDVTPLKRAAVELNEELAKINYLGKSDFGGQVIDTIVGFDDALTFSSAQRARSTLIELGNVAEAAGEDKLKGSIRTFEGLLTDAMDQAAHNQSPETFIKYKAIKREAEAGYSAFKNQFIWNFMNDKLAIEKMSGELFKPGNSHLITKFRKVLNQAAKNDPLPGRRAINPVEVMDQVKQNYLEDVLNQSSKPVPLKFDESVDAYMKRTGVPKAEDLLTFFSEDPKITTMKKLFSKREQQALLDFTKAVQATQEVNPAGMSMVVQLMQGGYMAKLVHDGANALRGAASLVLGTSTMAKMMTSPEGIKLLTSAAKTSIWSKEAPVIASKLAAFIADIKREELGRDTMAEDVGNYLKGASVNLGNAALEVIGLDDDSYNAETPEDQSTRAPQPLPPGLTAIRED